jgi:hypothetical protein
LFKVKKYNIEKLWIFDGKGVYRSPRRNIDPGQAGVGEKL